MRAQTLQLDSSNLFNLDESTSQALNSLLKRSSTQKSQRLSISYPAGSGDSHALAQTIAQHSNIPLWLIITEHVEDSHRLQHEINFFAPELEPVVFPDWELLPYDTLSPHQDLVSERLSTLYAISQKQIKVLIVAANTLVHRLAPPSFLAGRVFFFKQGETRPIHQIKEQLATAGYQSVQQVLQPGEFSVRGGVVDLFPMGSALPYRLDFFGDEIESIKVFDVDTQKSLYPVPEIRLLPGREFPFDEPARTKFREGFRSYFDSDPTRSLVYKDVGNGIPSAGIENWLPLFFDQTSSLLDYLGPNALVVEHGSLELMFKARMSEAYERYELYRHDKQRPIMHPEAICLSSEQLFTQLQSFNRLHLKQPQNNALSSLFVARDKENPLQAFSTWQQQTKQQSQAILIVAESSGRQETMISFFADHGIVLTPFESYAGFLNAVKTGSFIASQHIAITHGAQNSYVYQGSYLQSDLNALDHSIWIITERELYPNERKLVQRNKRAQKASNVDTMIRDLAELGVGDAVVHHQHGVARYLGLVELPTSYDNNNQPLMSEFLHLEYAKGAKLYVPVEQLHLVNQYTGQDPENAPLHSLGSGQWEKARRKAAEQVRDTAAELLNLYAQRESRQGHSFRINEKDYRNFCEGFGFEETPDQKAAIEAVVHDMQRAKPMDRLVCGDVGFGKTEVALRAAFVAVMNNKQVALLAPTTLLVEQHFQTFSDRFAPFGAKVVELSRFNSSKQTKEAIEQIKAGQADIVIGTHQLLSPSIEFKDLGLVMIDEEHRFGVRHKEALKTMRAEVDILALTATPIPRTLSMSLEGIRDFSVIATAPQKRLAIKTLIRPEVKSVIREAILRETMRGGQVYFLHNRVETIQQRYEELKALLPDIRIAVAHGQMPERELAATMRDFAHQHYNVLVCSTIIETGIDIPTANTIIIHRADKFGIAQLHQLRGRVGRSHHQAYAYLLIPEEAKLDKKAELRLEAIANTEELGSGFYLAMHDLEIRGAGEMLGEAQSGSMQEIGFALYQDMLKTAIEAAKRGEMPDFEAPLKGALEIHLGQPALIPKTYCEDIQERLSLYKRIATSKHEDELIDLRESMRDRFGEMPDACKALFEAQRLRLRYQPIGLERIDATAQTITLSFQAQNKIDAAKVIKLVQTNRQVSLVGSQKIKWTRETKDWGERVKAIHELIAWLI